MMCSQCNERPRYRLMNICTVCRGERRRGDRAAKDRENERKRERYRNPESRRRTLSTNTRWRYGLTVEQVDELVEAQGGCAICGIAKPETERGWHVDHDHACCTSYPTCGNCTRGILCHDCNVGLGHFRDDPNRLSSAIEYLRKTS